MKVKTFVKKYIEPNSLVRLIYKTKEGHKTVLNNWNEVSMEWEMLKNEGKYKNFINNEVVGVTDILTKGPYSEAINIVIKK